MDSGVPVTAHGKFAAAEHRVAARTVCHRGLRAGEAFEFGNGGMDVMRHHGTIAAKAVTLVDTEVIHRPREHPGDLADLLLVLIQVAL